MTHTDQHYEKAIHNLVPINALSDRARAALLPTIERVELPRGHYLFRSGDEDPHHYYVLKGSIDLELDGRSVQRVSATSDVARYALAHATPRTVDARAATPVVVARVPSASFEPAADGAMEVAEIDDEEDTHGMTRMLQSALFRRLPAANIQALFARMVPVEVSAGEVVIEQGAVGDYYYVLQQGDCEVSRIALPGGDRIMLASLVEGQGFGEEALVSGTARNASVTMTTDGVVMRIGKRDFDELIKQAVVTRVNRERAERRIQEGAVWLDVRTPEEHHVSAPSGSLNVPLEALRMRVSSLDADRGYVCCCDNGERSAAATFVLIQYDIDACYLGAGLGLSQPSRSKDRRTARLRDEETVVRARMVRTGAELDNVRRMRDAAARRLNQEHLALERRAAETERRLKETQRLKCEAEAARRDVEEVMEDSLRTSREQLEAEGTRAQLALGEVERLKRDLEEVRGIAGTERRHKQARESELERLKGETQARLRNEEARLGDERARHQLELDRLRVEMEEADGRPGAGAGVRAGADPVTSSEQTSNRADPVSGGPTPAPAVVSIEDARRAARDEAARTYARYREALKVAMAKEKAELRAERERLEAEAERVQGLLEDLRRSRAESEQLAAVRRAASLHTSSGASPPSTVATATNGEIELLPESEIRPPDEVAHPTHKPDGDEDRVLNPDRIATIRGRQR